MLAASGGEQQEDAATATIQRECSYAACQTRAQSHTASASAVQRLQTSSFSTAEIPNRLNLGEDGNSPITAGPKPYNTHPFLSQRYYLGVGHEGTGKLQQAIVEYQKAIEMVGGSQVASVALAHAYSALGKKAEAEKILRDLERESKESAVSPYTMATIYAGLGENDRAFEFLEEAYSEKSLDIIWSLKSDFLLDPLRPDPRFKDMLRRIGLTA